MSDDPRQSLRRLPTSRPGAWTRVVRPARRLAGRGLPGPLWRLAGLAPAAILALCSISADLVAVFGRDPIGIWQILPAGPVAGDWLGAELSSTAFLLIGMGLARRKRTAFWLGMSIAGGVLIDEAAHLDHPLSAVTAIILATILIATRERYDVGTGRRDAILAGALLAVGGIVVAVGAAAAATGVDVGAADAIGSFFDLATPVAIPGVAATGAILLLARVGYVAATALCLEAVEDQRSPASIAAARRTLGRLGHGSLLPYQMRPPSLPIANGDASAVIAVASIGRAVVTLGDPAGEVDAGDALLEEWQGRCRRSDLVPVVYQASGEMVARLRLRGWHAILIGREAVVLPQRFELRSAAVANLRHTITRARRGGVRTIWSATGLDGLADSRMEAGLVDLDAEWRRGAGPGLGFTVGTFDPNERTGSAIAVAVGESGEPEAFIVLRPTGTDGGWMLDLMRRRRGGTPGAVEACLVTAIEALRDIGVHRFSLGLAPLAGLDELKGPRPERMLARAARPIRPLYDVQGLAFFKNKFSPTWEPRYLVVRRWPDLIAAVIALLRLHLGGSWPRVVRSVVTGLAPAR